MPKFLIVATIFFLVGMVLIISGMLGAAPAWVTQLGSALAIVAVLLRIVGRLKS